MNKILFILCLTSASLWMLSCTDYEVASYPEENETEVFNGTVLDYLSTGNERLNLKFDSMMVLVNNIPGFIQLRGSIQNVAWTKCRTKYVKPLVHR